MDDVLNFFKDVFDFGGSLDTINFCLELIPSWIISFVCIYFGGIRYHNYSG